MSRRALQRKSRACACGRHRVCCRHGRRVMADRTKIEWTDATVNAVNGCSVLSPGCTNCYAMKLAGTRLRHHPSRAGLTVDSKAGPVWRSEEHTSELQSLMRISYAVFCLKQKTLHSINPTQT